MPGEELTLLIDEDLRKLAPTTHCVRTYSSAQGLDAVADLAPEHDLDVLLGIWIAREPKDNAKEIEAGLRAAKAHPERIRAIVVGNEALLRREVTAAQLIDEIGKVRARTDVPLTYADVWEFWLKNPEVAAHDPTEEAPPRRGHERVGRERSERDREDRSPRREPEVGGAQFIAEQPTRCGRDRSGREPSQCRTCRK